MRLLSAIILCERVDYGKEQSGSKDISFEDQSGSALQWLVSEDSPVKVLTKVSLVIRGRCRKH